MNQREGRVSIFLLFRKFIFMTLSWKIHLIKSNYYSSSDSILLTGHIKLLKSLLSCQGVDKREVGRAVIPQFLTTYLFPASKLISEGGLSDTASGQTTSRFLLFCCHY